MSLFHSLQDVYYDAMHLQEALEDIPSKCDCWDAEAHLSGRCCCVSAEGTVGGTMAFRQGCLHHLEKLSKSLTALQEDSRGGSGETRLELDFVHFVMPAQAPASQNGQSQRHFSMS